MVTLASWLKSNKWREVGLEHQNSINIFLYAKWGCKNESYSWDVSFTLTKEVVKKQLETIVKNHWDFLIIFFSTREFKRRARLNIKLLKILYPTIHSKKSCQFLWVKDMLQIVCFYPMKQDFLDHFNTGSPHLWAIKL